MLTDGFPPGQTLRYREILKPDDLYTADRGRWRAALGQRLLASAKYSFPLDRYAAITKKAVTAT